VCRICDRKFILYLRYQQYAREIGIKDQLINENTVQINAINREIANKAEKILKI
jgi:hypothetical protein